MLTAMECRRLLGPVADGLSDKEILEIRDTFRELAEIALETLAPQATSDEIAVGALP